MRFKPSGSNGGAGEGTGAGLARIAIAIGVVVLVLLPLLLTLPSLDSNLAGDNRPVPEASPSPQTSPSAPPPPPPPSPVPPPPPPPPPPITVVPALYPKIGSTGPDVLAIEQRLEALSYMTGKVDGVFDRATFHAVRAFQKVEGLDPSGVADAGTQVKLQSAARPTPVYAVPPEHIEVDIKRQVVLVVRGGTVTATLSTSTGNNRKFTSEGRTRRAYTPNGQYTISYKRQGWRTSPLGKLYRPAYFNGGIALHGAPSVPARPASHGCVRLPMPFADWFAENASPVGMTVLVFGGPVGENPAPTLTDAPAAPPPPGAPPEPAPAPAQPPPSPAVPPSPSPSPEPLLPGLLQP